MKRDRRAPRNMLHHSFGVKWPAGSSKQLSALKLLWVKIEEEPSPILSYDQSCSFLFNLGEVSILTRNRHEAILWRWSKKNRLVAGHLLEVAISPSKTLTNYMELCFSKVFIAKVSWVVFSPKKPCRRAVFLWSIALSDRNCLCLEKWNRSLEAYLKVT